MFIIKSLQNIYKYYKYLIIHNKKYMKKKNKNKKIKLFHTKQQTK